MYGDTYTMHAGATDQILGITSLQLGVFGGILVGLGVGYLHNRFYKIKLPEVLSFLAEQGQCRLFVPLYMLELEY